MSLSESPLSLDTIVHPSVLEGTNGSLIAVLILVGVGALANVGITAWQIKYAGIFESWHDFAIRVRSISKPSIAIAVAAFGLALRVGTIWWLRWLVNHGYPPPWWAPMSEFFVVFGTVVAVAGFLCWMRVTLPDFLGRGWWFAGIMFVLAFGAFMSR